MSPGNTEGGEAVRSPAKEPPLLKLSLTNIGSIREAAIELLRGFTALYGANGSGKTAVARALRLLAKLNNAQAKGIDILELINKEKKEGAIVYEGGGAKQMLGCKLDKAGAQLSFNKESFSVFADDRLDVLIENPAITLAWVSGDSVKLFGVGAARREGPYKLGDLLRPSVFRSFVLGANDVAELYEQMVTDVNEMLEDVTDYRIEYRDGVYFKRGLHVFKPDLASAGVLRLALIFTAVRLTEAMADIAGKTIPVVFIENLEAPLFADYLSSLVDILHGRTAAIVGETHSGLVLRAAVMKANYYVFVDGTVAKNLKPEYFWREVQIWSSLGAP
jgi:ABC-type dipeptide/oligopeptide/nickel transport system ATPase component